jgi:CRP/FNR family transcriptional regulator, cyclic AMP receptor protein
LQKPKNFDSASILRRVPLFMGLSEDQVYLLVQICAVRKVEKDHIVFRQGTEGSEAFIILSGSVRIESLAENGLMTTLAVRKPGEVLGEMSIIDMQPRSASGVANEFTRLLVIRADDFAALVRRNPDLSLKLMRNLCARLRELSKNVAESRLESLEIRILRYLQTKADQNRVVHLNASQRLVAQELGCTREALNRNLKRLESTGMISPITRNVYKLNQ